MTETKKNSLLIIDDEPSNLKVLTHILGKDYTIYTAKAGKTGIKMAKEFLPDLILLDIIMPEMDGYEVLTRLKHDEKTNPIPVIFISGLKEVEDEEKGLAMQAADYISKPFSPAIVKLRVHNQIQIVNQMRAIEHLSMMDQLTDIPNRRCFDNRLRIEWGRAVRDGICLGILMLDIDKFKNYNDTYGHQQGDTALKRAAEIFSSSLRRSTDLAARFGGEEFVVLLPETDAYGAVFVAEQIRLRTEAETIPCLDGTLTRITVSVGVHTQIPDRSTTIDSFIACADRALYVAKESGRNRVCRYGAE